MNKKFTLLAAALMTVGTFTAASAASDVPSKEWTVGNYYYLKSGNKYLSLDGNKADSVVVKEITSFENVNKAARDSALWEITGITETAGTVRGQVFCNSDPQKCRCRKDRGRPGVPRKRKGTGGHV